MAEDDEERPAGFGSGRSPVSKDADFIGAARSFFEDVGPGLLREAQDAARVAQRNIVNAPNTARARLAQASRDADQWWAETKTGDTSHDRILSFRELLTTLRNPQGSLSKHPVTMLVFDRATGKMKEKQMTLYEAFSHHQAQYNQDMKELRLIGETEIRNPAQRAALEALKISTTESATTFMNDLLQSVADNHQSPVFLAGARIQRLPSAAIGLFDLNETAEPQRLYAGFNAILPKDPAISPTTPERRLPPEIIKPNTNDIYVEQRRTPAPPVVEAPAVVVAEKPADVTVVQNTTPADGTTGPEGIVNTGNAGVGGPTTTQR